MLGNIRLYFATLGFISNIGNIIAKYVFGSKLQLSLHLMFEGRATLEWIPIKVSGSHYC